MASGDLDLSFGVAGSITFDSSLMPGDFGYQGKKANDCSYSIQSLAEGGFLVGGGDGGFQDFVRKFSPNGVPDVKYGNFGKAKIGYNLGSFDKFIPGSNGEIFALSSYIHKLSSTGEPIANFGTGGQKDIGGFAYAGSLDQRGKILVLYKAIKSGSQYYSINCGCLLTSTYGIVKLDRFNADGSNDLTFHGPKEIGGVFTTSDTQKGALVVQPDGKIVVAVSTPMTIVTPISVARFNSDGSPDLDFNGVGFAQLQLDYVSINAVSLQPDGKIVVGGASDLLIRFNKNGTLDLSFGIQGQTIQSPIGERIDIMKIFISGNGDIIAVGKKGTFISNNKYYTFEGRTYSENGVLIK
jgi:uncharacterized delta-60 repeat protein